MQQDFVPPYEAFGVEKDGALIGGWLFNDHSGTNMECTAVGKVAFKGFWTFLARYAYITNRCNRVSFTFHEKNTHAIKIMERFGAKYEGRKRKYYGEYDAVLYGLTKEDLPDWIKTRALIQ
jgi:RimJ/RimL family protein N-acetyltransferase